MSAADIIAIIGAVSAAAIAVITAWRSLDRKIEKVHLLVNSSRTANLRLLAKTAKRLALVSKDPADKLDYENAQRDLEAAEDATRAAERT